jgi:DNA end-binding protein Ku
MAEAAERVESEAEEGARAGRGMWSGTVSFGLVSIPVNLVSGVRHGGIALRMLGQKGTPLMRRYVGSVEGKEVPADHIVRGYEIKPGKFVVIEDKELEAIAPEMSRDIDLRRFVKLAEIDPVFFDRPYYLAPGGSSTKAYGLLAQVMESSGRAGIATFVMRGKQYLVAIMAQRGVLRAETLRFADEVRTVAQVGLPRKKKATRSTLTRIEKAMRKLTGSAVKPAEMVNERDRRLVELIAKKQRAGDVVTAAKAKDPDDAVVIDLIERIKRSLRNRPQSKRRSAKASRRAA